MRHVLSKANYPGKNESVAIQPDPLIVGTAAAIHEKDEQVLKHEESVDKAKAAKSAK